MKGFGGLENLLERIVYGGGKLRIEGAMGRVQEVGKLAGWRSILNEVAGEAATPATPATVPQNTPTLNGSIAPVAKETRA